MEKNVSVRAVTDRATKNGFLVYVRYTSLGKQFKQSSSVHVADPISFNNKVSRKNRLTKTLFSSDRDFQKINDLVSRFNMVISEHYDSKRSYPSINEFKSVFLNIESSYPEDLILLFEKFKDYQKSKRRSRYGDGTGSIIHAIKEISTEERENRNYQLNDLTEKFFTSLFNYMLFEKPQNATRKHYPPKHKLEDLHHCSFDSRFGITNNTLIKRISDFKQFVRWLKENPKLDQTLKIDIDDEIQKAIDKLKITEYQNERIAFRAKEIDVLSSENFENIIAEDSYQMNINGKTKYKKLSRSSLIKAKDFFLFLCSTGIRISDFRKLNIRNITYNQQVSQKTQSGYFLYRGNALAFDILKKYNYDFALSDQKLNNYLKPLMRQFFNYYKDNFDKNYELEIEQIEWRGRYRQIENKEKWNLVSSHTGRRSFATYMYFDTEKASKRTIMKYTGHKSEREFNKYIQFVDDEDLESPLENLSSPVKKT